MDSINMRFSQDNSVAKDGTWTMQCNCRWDVACQNVKKSSASLQEQLENFDKPAKVDFEQFDKKPRLK